MQFITRVLIVLGVLAGLGYGSYAFGKYVLSARLFGPPTKTPRRPTAQYNRRPTWMSKLCLRRSPKLIPTIRRASRQRPSHSQRPIGAPKARLRLTTTTTIVVIAPAIAIIMTRRAKSPSVANAASRASARLSAPKNAKRRQRSKRQRNRRFKHRPRARKTLIRPQTITAVAATMRRAFPPRATTPRASKLRVTTIRCHRPRAVSANGAPFPRLSHAPTLCRRAAANLRPCRCPKALWADAANRPCPCPADN